MRRALLWLFAFLGMACVETGVTICASGIVCPAGSACSASGDACVAPSTCGDGITEGDEVCDDGNRDDGDGCSSSCLSDETCGNGVVDLIAGEVCDGVVPAADCVAMGFDWGPLECSSSCDIDIGLCGTIGATSLLSLPGTSPSAVWAFPSGEILVGNNSDRARYFDLRSWAVHEHGLASVTGFWAANPTDIVAVGTALEPGAAASRFDGQGWTLLSSPTYLFDVDATPDGDIYGVGTGDVYSPQLYHLEGDAFAQMDLGAEVSTVIAAWPAATDQIYISYRTTDMRNAFGLFDGEQLTPVVVGLQGYEAARVEVIAGTGPDDLFLITTSPAAVLHNNGLGWSERAKSAEAGSPFKDLHAFAPGHAIVTTSVAFVPSLTVVTPTSARTITVPIPAQPKNLWAIGQNQVLLPSADSLYEFRGNSWLAPPPLTAGASFRTSAAYDEGGFIVAGHGGTVVNEIGSGWDNWCTHDSAESSVRCPSIGDDLNGVWATGKDIFAVAPQGIIWTGKAESLARETSPSQEDLFAVDGLGASVFAVGANGTFLRRNGSAWESLATDTTADLRGVAVTADGAIAVGNGGTALRYTSQGVVELEAPPTVNLVDAWADDEGSVFAVGDSGTFLRIDGSTVEEIRGFTTADALVAIAGRTSTDVFVASATGQLFHYDGSTVSTVRLPKALQIVDIAADGSDLLVLTEAEIHRLARVVPW